jgi:hypothetical protein
MNEISISINKEIDKPFFNFICKKIYFPPDLDGNLFKRTFNPLLEMARGDIAMALRQERILRSNK